MNYNHNYTTVEVDGMEMINKTFCMEKRDGPKCSKFGSVRRTLLSIKRADGTAPFLRVQDVKTGMNAGSIKLLYHDNPLNSSLVANLEGKLAS